MSTDEQPVNVGFLVALAVTLAGLAIIVAGFVMRADRIYSSTHCGVSGYPCSRSLDVTMPFVTIIAGAIVAVVAVLAAIRSAS